jgi:hypothetical protein
LPVKWIIKTDVKSLENVGIVNKNKLHNYEKKIPMTFIKEIENSTMKFVWTHRGHE